MNEEEQKIWVIRVGIAIDAIYAYTHYQTLSRQLHELRLISPNDIDRKYGEHIDMQLDTFKALARKFGVDIRFGAVLSGITPLPPPPYW